MKQSGIGFLSFVFFLSSCKQSPLLQFDEVYFEPISVSSISLCSDFSIERTPDHDDSLIYESSFALADSELTVENLDRYQRLAYAMLYLGKLPEAKRMFLAIFNSKPESVTERRSYTSDIPGDTTSNIYGYGSFTTNYMHSICLTLAAISLGEQHPAEALDYVRLADEEYPLQYNCGTGHQYYRERMDGYYGLCYDGLNWTDTILDKFLPKYYDYSCGILVKTIRKKYSSEEIHKQIDIAESSIQFTPDTFQCHSYVTSDYGTPQAKTTELTYTTGDGTMILFGHKIELQRLSLQDGEVISKEHFIKEFRETGFYKELMK